MDKIDNFKLVIAGSRTLDLDPVFIISAMKMFNLKLWETDTNEIVSGGAEGVDASAELIPKYIGTPIKVFKADWETHGKGAGPIRNKKMAEYGDALLLIWDGESKGSSNMKKTMLSLNKPVYEVIMKGPK
jgi:hypothetical protein